ncbi:hypothetical protein DTO217A2_8569 [Paecilomyces variotii]|nr:hypothetical protein DTO217A2_8569 [Paecilomyces variotii]
MQVYSSLCLDSGWCHRNRPSHTRHEEQDKSYLQSCAASVSSCHIDHTDTFNETDLGNLHIHPDPTSVVSTQRAVPT